MRSRYCAYVRCNKSYLLRTWHQSTRPEKCSLDDGIKWLGLRIVRTERGAAGDSEGIVEFKAFYLLHGRKCELWEKSSFVFESGQWFYVDGM